ncbi:MULTISPECIES: hypothetical protein [unclassified Pseudovibrio]|uniref:hypothetical protein n=1 Tax=unclassified Pseudovibrio TaxID=2627060 RepID=UPI001FCB4C44|nr:MULTISPECIES: hypothetical protein [unclassified Pseudovibrio]
MNYQTGITGTIRVYDGSITLLARKRQPTVGKAGVHPEGNVTTQGKLLLHAD